MESYKTFTFTLAGEEGGQHEATEGGALTMKVKTTRTKSSGRETQKNLFVEKCRLLLFCLFVFFKL